MAVSGGLIVTNNLSALNTQRTLNKSNTLMSSSLAKLSSGYRINTASDDPSGLIISEQLRTQIAGLNRATQNSQEATNVLGIAEGALIEMNNILTKMRSLAIHAANNGVTAPDQVRADQAEVDSGIQTLDRISSTTRYSDQFLLNGSKGLVYDCKTTVDSTMDMPLLNTNTSRLDQVFKRNGSALTLGFSALDDPTNQTQAVWESQARRAYVEADSALNIDTDIRDGNLTADQSFIITGTQGSRQFAFANGTHVGTVVESINNVADSLGVGATMTFQSTVTGVNIDTAGSFNMTGGTARGSGDLCIYNLGSTMEPKEINGVYNYTQGVTGVTFDTTGTPQPDDSSLVPGKTLDGDGRMYLRWLTDSEYIAYKDKDMTMEIGRGTSGNEMSSTNNSGIDAARLNIETDPTAGVPAKDDVTVLQFGQQFEMQSDNIYLNEGLQYKRNAMNLDQMDSIVNNIGLCAGTGASSGSSALSGVRLGENTDSTGKMYFKAETGDPDSTFVTISVYKDPEMNEEDLVARGAGNIPPVTNGSSVHSDIPIFGVAMDGGAGENSGIYGTLAFQGGLTSAPNTGTEYTGSLEFTDLGMRLYTQDYGSQEYLRVQNLEGDLWSEYKNPESTTLTTIEAGHTIQEYGSDAKITVNGQLISTQGLTANVTTPNYSGKFDFNQGELGLTTIAQVGQDMGALMSRNSSLQAVASTNSSTINDYDDPAYLTWCTNARHATSETMSDFIGGMQYQLGEGTGDQERTVYAIPGMTAAEIGKMTVNGEDYCLQDVLAGGKASLQNDPVTAMKIVMQAVNDVSELRARLGAFQKNMLQTNINSLEVTVENITKTESAIRDTNMATESTEFTKNQILLQAGTSMLAQANKINQNVLQLLG